MQYVFTVYDMKNRKKIVVKGNAKECCVAIHCDLSTIYKNAKKGNLLGGRYLIKRRLA